MAKTKERISTRFISSVAPRAVEEIAASAAEAAVEQSIEQMNLSAANASSELTPEQLRLQESNSIASAAEAGAQQLDMTYASNFVPAGSNGTGPVTQLNWHRLAQIVEKQLDQIPISKRLHEVIRDHTLGLGLTVEVKAKSQKFKKYEQSLQLVCQNLIFGSRNRLNAKVSGLIMERSAIGETLLHVDVNPHDGSLTVGYMDPRGVSGWETDARDRSKMRTIKTQDAVWKNGTRRGQEYGKMQFFGEPVSYKVIDIDTDYYVRDKDGNPVRDETGNAILNKYYGRLSGEVFWWRNTVLPSQARGRGHTFSQVDWINTVDQGIYDFLRRFDAQAAVVWDLLIKGGTPKEIAAWAKVPIPRGRIPFTHNERFELNPKSPSLKIEDLTQFIRTLFVLISGTVGLPEYMMGDGSNTNVATAKEQSPGLYAKFDNNRGMWEDDLSTLCRFAVECANDRGMLSEMTEQEGEFVRGMKCIFTQAELDEFEIMVKFKPHQRSQAQVLGTVLKGIVDAITAAVAQGFCSKDLATSIFQANAAELGVKIDPESENSLITQEQSVKGMTPAGNAANYTDMMGGANAAA